MNPPASVEDERAFASRRSSCKDCRVFLIASPAVTITASPVLKKKKKTSFKRPCARAVSSFFFFFRSSRDVSSRAGGSVVCFVYLCVKSFEHSSFPQHRRPSSFASCTPCFFARPSTDLDAGGCVMDVRDVPRTRCTRGRHATRRGGRARRVYFGTPPRTVPSR